MSKEYETVTDIIADRDALRKDAERYRWLRERHDMTHQDWHVRDTFNNPPEIGGLDAAIDAAMNGANARIEPGRCE